MFQQPPENERAQISAQPLPPVHSPAPSAESETSSLSADAPRGDELFYHVLTCLEKGSTKAEVRKQLIAFGYSTGEAEETVEAVAAWRRQNPDVNIANHGRSGGGNASMWIGGIICLAGILITVGSCMAAGEGGGRYVVAWGAIIFGGIQFFRGLSQNRS